MKLICTQEKFKHAISIVERIVSRQTTLPILNNILFEAKKNGLFLSATNLEIGIALKIGAKIEKEGKITIPAKLISSFISNLPGNENISLDVNDQGMKIKSGSYKAVIKGLSAADFPLIPQKTTEPQIKINSQELKSVINKTLISVAPNETRQELTGVNVLLGEKEIFFASTDSFRLSESRIVLEEKDVNKELYKHILLKKDNLIIPANTLLELQRIIGAETEENVGIIIEEGQIFFEIGEVSMVSRLINGKYPDYKHILPKEFQSRAVVDKNILISSVKMASLFSKTQTSEINLRINEGQNNIIIEAASVETGENKSEINADINGPSQEVILNSRYLLDGIGTIATPMVGVLVNNGTNPIALKEIKEDTGEVMDDYVYIVMPIKN